MRLVQRLHSEQGVSVLFIERKSLLGRQLSGGEQEMLAIARPLLLNPRLMLLDEPSQGLAPLVVREIIEMVRHMRERGLPVLLIEQNAPLSLSISDHAYVLDDGKVVLRRRCGRSSEAP